MRSSVTVQATEAEVAGPNFVSSLVVVNGRKTGKYLAASYEAVVVSTGTIPKVCLVHLPMIQVHDDRMFVFHSDV